LLFVLVTALAACSGGTKDCPVGQRLWQGECVPVSDQDLVGDDWKRPDTSDPEPVGPEPVDEVADAPSDADAPRDSTPDLADVPDSDFVATGQVGSPCTSPNDCDPGLSCLGGWPGGYCTKKECDGSGDCPEGSACFALAEGFKTCVDLCTDSGQCRTAEGYRCKTFDDGLGEPLRMCYSTTDAAGGTGAPCDKHEDCGGESQCLFSFPYGYCARVFCSADQPCADGDRCVRLNGVPTCLKGCAASTDCAWQGVDYELVCKAARDVDNTQVKVCLTNVSGEPLGSACKSDFECDTGLACTIVSRGRCVLGAETCLSDADCPRANDFCVMSEPSLAGLCTKSCSSGQKCPAGTTQCVSHDGTTGTCLPACFNANLCPGGGAMSCVYGDPLSSTTGAAVSVCAVVYLGDPGAPCAADSECDSGDCVLGSAGVGYCSTACPVQLLSVCPFPLGCATVAGQKRCHLRCDATANACPAGFACQQPAGDPWVCVPL
jgi:hypothetical protein